jgi:hypothetical protein
MKERLRIGFASIEDANSISSWSGIPMNILNVLQKRPDLEVELISPMGQMLKHLFVIPKLYGKWTHRAYDWKREDLCLRRFAHQIETAVRDRKLDVVFSTSSIPGTRLDVSIPFVFWTDATFHGMDGYYTSLFLERTRRLGRRQEEAALLRATFSCFASEWAASGARRFADPDRVKVLPLGPNLPVTHTDADIARWTTQRRHERPTRCSLLFIGVGWERKGGAIALETARHLNESGIATTLRVVGSEVPGPVPSYVESLGFINKREPEGQRRLIDLYRSSDIFILPSRAEAFGVVVSEAAAFGLPALVTDTGGLSETVRDGKTGFRIPLQDKGTLFAEKARTIMESYEIYSRNAYSEFKNRLNWETSVDHLAFLLQRAVQNNPKRAEAKS